jgi:hypothetical protein
MSIIQYFRWVGPASGGALALTIKSLNDISSAPPFRYPIIISSCTFVHNVIQVKGSAKLSQPGPVLLRGGALYLISVNISLDNNTFINNVISASDMSAAVEASGLMLATCSQN